MLSSLELPKPSCLVVDDESAIRKTLSLALEADGWQARSCASLDSAREAIEQDSFDLALVDLRLGTQSGLDLLPLLKASQPELPVIMITAYATVSTAVAAMRRGAVDYLPKPFTPSDVRKAASQALALRSHQRREEDLESQALMESRVPALRKLLGQARMVAESGSTALLLRGETGTGKGVLAKSVHAWSSRSQRPFAVVACPALPADLLESELFGHAQGAFTGAYRDHKGRLAQAEGGTLFLDEIGDLPMSLQVKILRLIQDKEYERLGESETRRTDVRVIAATHVDLAAAIKAGKFREDLYYRLNVVEPDPLPPLRGAPGGLGGLAAAMLKELRQEAGRGPLRLEPQVLKRFQAHSWPGNLREMRNVLERACVMGQGEVLELKDLAPSFGQFLAPAKVQALASLDQVELAQIRRVLASAKTLEQAAKILGVDVATLWRKRKKHQLYFPLAWAGIPMEIRQKIRSGIGGLLLILLLAALSGIWVIGRSKRATEALFKNNYNSVDYMHQLSESLEQLNKSPFAGILAGPPGPGRLPGASPLEKNIEGNLLAESNDVTEPGEQTQYQWPPARLAALQA